MRPAQAAAGCVVAMRAAAIAAKPARNRLTVSLLSGLGRDAPMTPPAGAGFRDVARSTETLFSGQGPPGLRPVPHPAGALGRAGYVTALGRPALKAEVSAKSRRNHREED